jgi:hypothetical protein
VIASAGIRRFDDDFEPSRVGSAFFIEEDGADGSLIDGLSAVGVHSFVIIDAIVVAEEEGDDSGSRLVREFAVGRQVEAHGGGLGHRGGEDKEGDQEEPEVNHGGEVDAGGELFGFGDAGGFAIRDGGGDFGHGGMVLKLDARGIRFHKEIETAEFGYL